ncbi:hypothetical protein AAG570_010734 [Ranatra chinensis]|uniref:Uncharacterized protein n=1 Tax=Ranatra chinensis TaxID=642074 RepID=A0ABD0YNI1_9HEMI
MMKAAQQGGQGSGGQGGGSHMLGNPPHTPGMQGPNSPQPPAGILGGNGSSSGSQHSPGGGGGGGGGGGYLGGHVGGTPTPSSTPVSDMSPQPPHGMSGSPPVPWEMKPNIPPPTHHHPHHHPPAPGYMPQYSWYQTEPNPGLLT